MKKTFFRCLGYLAVFMVMCTFNIDAAIKNSSDPTSVRLSDHVPTKALAHAVLLKQLDADLPISITFVLPLRDQKILEEVLHSIYNPVDQEHYGKYLSSEEFIKMFSPTEADYDAVVAYAKEIGLNIIGTHPNRLLLNVSGPTKTIESAFNLKLQQYQLTSGRKFYAPNKNPEVPKTIASIISGIVGLDNFAVRQPFYRIKETSEEMASTAKAVTYPSGPQNGFGPNDIKIAYNLSGVSANGSGQSIALFELGAYQRSDITAYTTYFGLPSANLHNVIVDGGAGTAIDPEVTLDIELALALAPQSQIYVYEGPNSDQGALDTYNRIATDNIAKQVSTSWGLGEDQMGLQSIQAENSIFQQMAAQGQTLYAAAGDSGAYSDYPSTDLVVMDPASQPYAVGTGGTNLTVNSASGAYIREIVWNNGVGNGAGGGGVSQVWPIPSWQTNIATTYSTTHRNVPDISLNADPDTGYSIYYNGSWTLFGGTSCAAPLWAAFTALVNQQRQSTQMSVLGFANPTLYSIAKTAQGTNFHDISVGDNYFYQARVGYDNATGWGSFNGANLFASLTNSSPTVPTMSITSPGNGSTVRGTIAFTAIATDSLGITKIDFYADSRLLGSATVSPYTISLDTTTLSDGQHTLTAIAYDTAGNFIESAVTVTVNNAVPNIYINAGGGKITDSSGITWLADKYYLGGQAYTSILPASLGVYITARSARGGFSYNIPASNGNHNVTLKFAEISFKKAGKRVFDVYINSQKVISKLDIFKKVGFGKPLDLSFPVHVTNKKINVVFVPVVNSPIVNGIEVSPN